MKNTFENYNISIEVLELLKSEMTDAATIKLINIVKQFEECYGNEVTEIIMQVDEYINQYQTNEIRHKEIIEQIDYFQNNNVSYGVDDLLSTIKKKCEPDQREYITVSRELYDLGSLKKFISDIAVVFALNEPLYERKRNEIIKKYNLNS